MADSIKAIISDIGGVIIRFPDEEYYAYLAKISGHKPIEIGRIIKKMTPPLEREEISLQEFEDALSAKIGVKESKIHWFEFYKRQISMDIDMTDLLEELHKEYTVAYLSNIDASKYALLKRLLGKELFDYRFASCELRLRKPDPKIFRYVLRKMGLRAKETIFIDNQIENVRAAERVGMHSILYKSRRLLDISLSKLLD